MAGYAVNIADYLFAPDAYRCAAAQIHVLCATPITPTPSAGPASRVRSARRAG
ncbi:hypothetical protein [Streptomyces pseudovenezuelae]|uniref:hypothetical protein n=1 Tax=Streptomyces pseudovenezuelae TaxID=67350 RepID=UPI002E376417|nr:hypothetical protein [Streptomyces pseudovenezuelae]